MASGSSAVLTGLALLSMTSGVIAHHSFAMFDTAHPIEISGVVKEFRYANPHSVWVVEVKRSDGTSKDWVLEGPAPGIMARQGGYGQYLQAG